MNVKKSSLFFFVYIYNYLFLRNICFPYFYNIYGYSAYLIIIIMCILIALMLYIIPKKIYKYNFLDKINNSRLRIILDIYLIFRIILIVFIGTYILYKLYFSEYNFYILSFGFILVIVMLSNIKASEVIQLSTLFGIISIFCYVLYLYDFINMDYYLLIKDINIDFNYLSILIFLSIFFDNIIYFICDKDVIDFSKGSIIFSIIMSIFVMLFEYFILILSSGNYLFLSYEYCGFQALAIEPVSRYNGNFDYVYILLIGVSVVFKSLYFSSIACCNKTINLNKKIWIFMFLLVGVCFLHYIANIKYSIIFYSSIILKLLAGFILIWIIGVIKNDKKAM